MVQFHNTEEIVNYSIPLSAAVGWEGIRLRRRAAVPRWSRREHREKRWWIVSDSSYSVKVIAFHQSLETFPLFTFWNQIFRLPVFLLHCIADGQTNYLLRALSKVLVFVWLLSQLYRVNEKNLRYHWRKKTSANIYL